MENNFNTVAMWTLLAGIVALGTTIVTGEHFHAERPEKMGYPIAGVVEDGKDDGAVKDPPIETMMANSDVAKGQAVFQKCAVCHTVNNGGANGTGPNLWAIVGKAHAVNASFTYSDALKAKTGNWDFASLNQWLKAPRDYAEGTKMTFAGLGDPAERANVIAYLNSNGSNLAMPKAAPAADAPAADKPAAK
jgi:cytochrome c